MQRYSGAIDYFIYKSQSKYIIILLDNHNPKSYCDNYTESKNIAKLFEEYIDKNSIFILEELVGSNPNDKIIELFNKTPHLEKYMEFYSKYKSDHSKIIPVDIRPFIDNFHKPNGFDLTDQLFGISNSIDHTVKSIQYILVSAIQSNELFASHYNHLKNKYIQMKQTVLNSGLTVCNDSTYTSNLNLEYPFASLIGTICEQQEQLLSGILELYTIAHILTSTNRYVFAYLGAAHCISIGSLLDKYYQIRKIKNLDKFEISGNKFNLELLDLYTESCVNFLSSH